MNSKLDENINLTDETVTNEFDKNINSTDENINNESVRQEDL